MSLDDLVKMVSKSFFGKFKNFFILRNWLLGCSLLYTAFIPVACDDSVPNKAPIIQDLAKIVVTEGDLVDVNPIVSDPEGGAVTITYSAPLDANGEWLTDYDDDGTHFATVTAEDNAGKKASKDVEIEVLDDNRLPVLDPIANINVDENDLIQVVLSANDPDTNNTLVYSINDPRLVKVSDDTFEWQTDYDDDGIYNFIATVDDQRGGIDNENLQITINDFNRPPVLVTPITPSPTPVRETEEVTVNIFSNDADLDAVVHTIAPLGYFTKITNTEFKWTLPYSATNLPSEAIIFTAKADDGRGGIDTEIFSVIAKDSRIVIERYDGSQRDLILINPDGSGAEQNITNTPGFNETNPQFTPDGEKVICLSNDTGSTEVYVIDLATLVKSQFSADPGATDPKIGPNQVFVYFKKGTNIWKRDFPSGNNPVNVTNNSNEHRNFKILPNGDEMIFDSDRFSSYFQIGKVDLTTLIVTQISAHAADDWRSDSNPTAQKITYQSNDGGAGTDIYAADITGFNDYALVSNGLINEFPTFTKSGNHVIYVCLQNVRKQAFPGGSNIAITSSNDVVGAPKTISGNSGDRILYVRNVGDYELFDNNEAGTDERQLTDNTVEDSPNFDHK